MSYCAGRACSLRLRVIDKLGARPQIASMAKVQIYTKAFCPFCARALKLLRAKDALSDEVDITMGGGPRTEMLSRANGRTTVPQIFIGDRHIGGSDDLAALERAGELDALLQA